MRSKRGFSRYGVGGKSDGEQTLPSPGTEMDSWLSRRGLNVLGMFLPDAMLCRGAGSQVSRVQPVSAGDS